MLRQYMHSESASPSVSIPHSSLSDPVSTRDSRYYYSDGNAVLLVENTLFKVHRSALTRENSVFESMFALCSDQCSGATNDAPVMVGPEGESDSNPIRLPGDTADEFRSLLWALYALPHEFEEAVANGVYPKLFNLARVARKYEFHAIEGWALDKIKASYLRQTHSVMEAPTLVQLTELASLCEQRDFFEFAVTWWRRRIASGMDIALAIGVAERLDIRYLLGTAYHAMLLQGREVWDADPELTRTHRVRLLSGYYVLDRLSERLPNEPPMLQHHPSCTGSAQTQCDQGWAKLWRSLYTGNQVDSKACKIFVGNLAYSTTDEGLIHFFASIQSEVASARITLRKAHSTGCGIVELSSADAARKAIVESLNGQERNGRKVVIEIATNDVDNKLDGLSPQSGPIIGRMILARSTLRAYIERELPDQGMLDAMPQCKERALMAARVKLKEVQESLADYFADVV